MGVLWLLAEGLIMIYVRKGYLFLSGRDARQRGFFWGCVLSFVLLAALRIGPSLGMGALFSPGDRLFGFRYYNGYVWNLYCTLWVIIEGAIAIYIFRIYRLIRAAVSEGEGVLKASRSGGGPMVLTLIFLAGFAGYHGYLAHLAAAVGLNPSAVYNILRFYIKICGLLWILFEWYVAVAGIKVFLLMKRAGSAADGVG